MRRTKFPDANKTEKLGAGDEELKRALCIQCERLEPRMTAQQRSFCDWYVRTWSGAESARRAGYKGKPTPVASRLLHKPQIVAHIKRRLAESAMAADEVLHRLGEQARGDISIFFKEVERWTDWPLPTEEILEEHQISDPASGAVKRTYRVRSVVIDVDALKDPAKSRLVKKFTDSPRSGIVLELYDAQAALSLIGKHHKLFSDQQVDITVRIRRLAEEHGLDPDEAVEEAMRILNVGSR